MFPNAQDVEAHDEANADRKRADIARKARFMARTDLHKWAELVIQELQQEYQQGSCHPSGVFPCDRSKLQAWLATNNPQPAADDRKAQAHYNPSLEYAVCRAIERHLDFSKVHEFECNPTADGFSVRVFMKIRYSSASTT